MAAEMEAADDKGQPEQTEMHKKESVKIWMGTSMGEVAMIYTS